MRKILSLLIAVVLGVSTAFATTVYCKMTHSWWYADGAAVAVHYWDDAKGDTPEPTAISNTAADAEAVKVLHNGMLLIRKGNKTYNVMGQAVK